MKGQSDRHLYQGVFRGSCYQTRSAGIHERPAGAAAGLFAFLTRVSWAKNGRVRPLWEFGVQDEGMAPRPLSPSGTDRNPVKFWVLVMFFGA